jgi:hypothetical protein
MADGDIRPLTIPDALDILKRGQILEMERMPKTMLHPDARRAGVEGFHWRKKIVDMAASNPETQTQL